MKDPIVCEPAQGSDYLAWGDRYSFKTTSRESGGAHALLEMTVQPGSGTPPHIHHAEDEMFYVLEGDLSFWCGDTKTAARAGSFVAIPRGTVHRWANESDRPARSLVLLVPGGFDDFLIRIGKPLADPRQPASPPTREEIDFAISIAPEYHMEVLKPET